jgi:hypothetical protein
MGATYSASRVVREWQHWLSTECSLDVVHAKSDQHRMTAEDHFFLSAEAFRTLFIDMARWSLAQAEDTGDDPAAVEHSDVTLKLALSIRRKERALLDAAFAKFDTAHRGSIPSADLWSGLCVLMGGCPVESKVTFLLSLYDMDVDGRVNEAELCLVMAACARGVCHLRGIPPPQPPAVAALARRAFQHKDGTVLQPNDAAILKGQHLSTREVLNFCLHEPNILALLQSGGVTDGVDLLALYQREQALRHELVDVDAAIAEKAAAQQAAAAFAAALLAERGLNTELFTVDDVELRKLAIKWGVDLSQSTTRGIARACVSSSGSVSDNTNASITAITAGAALYSTEPDEQLQLLAECNSLLRASKQALESAAVAVAAGTQRRTSRSSSSSESSNTRSTMMMRGRNTVIRKTAVKQSAKQLLQAKAAQLCTVWDRTVVQPWHSVQCSLKQRAELYAQAQTASKPVDTETVVDDGKDNTDAPIANLSDTQDGCKFVLTLAVSDDERSSVSEAILDDINCAKSSLRLDIEQQATATAAGRTTASAATSTAGAAAAGSDHSAAHGHAGTCRVNVQAGDMLRWYTHELVHAQQGAQSQLLLYNTCGSGNTSSSSSSGNTSAAAAEVQSLAVGESQTVNCTSPDAAKSVMWIDLTLRSSSSSGNTSNSSSSAEHTTDAETQQCEATAAELVEHVKQVVRNVPVDLLQALNILDVMVTLVDIRLPKQQQSTAKPTSAGRARRTAAATASASRAKTGAKHTVDSDTHDSTSTAAATAVKTHQRCVRIAVFFSYNPLAELDSIVTAAANSVTTDTQQQQQQEHQQQQQQQCVFTAGLFKRLSLHIGFNHSLTEVLQQQAPWTDFKRRLYGPQLVELDKLQPNEVDQHQQQDPRAFAAAMLQSAAAVAAQLRALPALSTAELLAAAHKLGISEAGTPAVLRARIHKCLSLEHRTVGRGSMTPFAAAAVKRLFRSADRDGDGSLSFLEALQLLRRIGGHSTSAATSETAYAEALKSMEVQTNLHGRLTEAGLLAFYTAHPDLANDLQRAGIGSLDDELCAGISCIGETDGAAVRLLDGLLDPETGSNPLSIWTLIGGALSSVRVQRGASSLSSALTSLLSTVDTSDSSNSSGNSSVLTKLVGVLQQPSGLVQCVQQFQQWLADGSDGLVPLLRTAVHEHFELPSATPTTSSTTAAAAAGIDTAVGSNSSGESSAVVEETAVTYVAVPDADSVAKGTLTLLAKWKSDAQEVKHCIQAVCSVKLLSACAARTHVRSVCCVHWYMLVNYMVSCGLA